MSTPRLSLPNCVAPHEARIDKLRLAKHDVDSMASYAQRCRYGVDALSFGKQAKDSFLVDGKFWPAVQEAVAHVGHYLQIVGAEVFSIVVLVVNNLIASEFFTQPLFHRKAMNKLGFSADVLRWVEKGGLHA